MQSLSLVLPHLQTSQQSLSVTFSIQTHNRCCPKLSNTLYQSYRVHGALLLGCVGVGCSRMALVGCTQMATDTTGLLQRMLPRLDATHLAVCIAVSKPFETSPENRNHSQAFGCCQPCLPCMTDLVLPRLQTRQKSLSATFSIKTHNRCISKAFQHFVEILSGARSFAAHMHWDLAVSKLGPTPPPDEAAIAKCDFLNPNTQSMHFQNFPTLCTNPIGSTELCCSDALGSDAVQWLWSAALKWLRTQLGCCNGCYQDL